MVQPPSAAFVPILILPLFVPDGVIDVIDLKILVEVTTPPFDPFMSSIIDSLSKPKPTILKVVPVVSSLLFICILAPKYSDVDKTPFNPIGLPEIKDVN